MNNECIFCKIINKEIPAQIIAENKNAIAFYDLYPISLGHTLIIPKKHYSFLSACDDDYLNDVTLLAKDVANQFLSLDVGIKGFNYLSNENEIAGQVINHFHLHLVPKYSKDHGFNTNHKSDVTHSNVELFKFKNIIKK